MTARSARHLASLLVVLALAAGTLAAAPAGALDLGVAKVNVDAVVDGVNVGAPGSAPASEATITPGVQMFTGPAQCTANFVFTDGADLYLGQAAHCAGSGGDATLVDGCLSPSLPVDTTSVDIRGADHPGTLAYSSWVTMQAVQESDPNTCLHNDFALVRLHPGDHGKVNPSVPFFGGPKALNTTGSALGEPVYSYGSSSLRLGLTPLSPKTGVSLGTTAGGWTHPVVTVTPGIPGDSGSAFLDADGNALGVLSTLMLAPAAGSNWGTDLHRALEYMRTHTGLDVQLVPGTRPFSPLL